MPPHEVRVGCAGWSIPKPYAGRFSAEGSHLARYAQRFPAVEVNSSFYRPHRAATYARWASETPEGFAFALKVPREVTHARRLVDVDEPLERFLDETSALGAKRGPLLVQLPPSLVCEATVVGSFWDGLRRRYDGAIACEPRHPSWFTTEAERLLRHNQVARVAADPAIVPQAARPGGWGGLVYYRLHGSPKIYRSSYSGEFLQDLANCLADTAAATPTWCLFDNTATGAATDNALLVWEQLEAMRGSLG